MIFDKTVLILSNSRNDQVIALDFFHEDSTGSKSELLLSFSHVYHLVRLTSKYFHFQELRQFSV